MKRFHPPFLATSLKNKILWAFIATSIIPILIMIVFSYFNSSRIIKDNVEELTHLNLERTRKSLDVWMDSYEDILFQAYMNDNVVETVDKLNQGIDTTLNIGQLRKTLRGMFYTKEYIKSISVLTESGDIVFYDLLTGKAMKNSWSDNIRYSKKELYDILSADNDTHIFSTAKAGTYADDTYFLFHIGHRIIDYRNLDKQLGVVIVSIDENLLRDICLEDGGENNYKFIVDNQGNLVSNKNDRLLGEQIIEWSDDIEVRKQEYLEYLELSEEYDKKYFSVDVIYDDTFGWDIVGVSNQNQAMKQLETQQKIMLMALMIALGFLFFIIRTLTGELMHSINHLVDTMKQVEEGEMDARVTLIERTPSEIQTISHQFNMTLDKLQDAMKKEKEASAKQRNAEIAALEAQINPHFLYNTLDTINWMAIDKSEFEISNSITSLAGILRYGLDNSNGSVTVEREVEWLKQYLFLQQTRLKETFDCELSVSPEVMKLKIHKLLLQPFVENAILHGFEGKKGTHVLKIEIKLCQDALYISIWDNGKGIPEGMVEQMNRGKFPEMQEKNCIGMENAITRISMYYEEDAKVQVESEYGSYTKIGIEISRIEEYQEK